MNNKKSSYFSPKLIYAFSSLFCLCSFFALVYTFSGFNKSSLSLAEAHESQFNSYLLADELRQSSDDLTRLVRTYAITADPKYRDQFFAVLDIRNGTKPRPKGYHKIYWDIIDSGEMQSFMESNAISLINLMKKEGFSEEELGALAKAKTNSDKLAEIEIEAIRVIDTLQEQFSGDHLRTILSLHDETYHKHKAGIMKPVDHFYELLEERTRKNILKAEETKLFWGQLMFVAAVIFCGSLIFLFLYHFIRKALIRPLKELENANTELEEFAYRISHDLRSPISSAIMLLRETKESIEEDEKEDALESLSIIQGSLSHLDNLIKNILNIMLLKNEEADEEVDLPKLVDEVLELFTKHEGRERLEIIKDFSDVHRIKTKPTALTLILENLTSNAIKYQNLEEESPYIKYTVKNVNNCLVLEVSDNGIGIPENQHKNVFSMFKRFHPKVSYGGGLGLYLVKKSADSIDAKIDFAPQDKGCIFRLTFNLKGNPNGRK